MPRPARRRSRRRPGAQPGHGAASALSRDAFGGGVNCGPKSHPDRIRAAISKKFRHIAQLPGERRHLRRRVDGWRGNRSRLGGSSRHRLDIGERLLGQRGTELGVRALQVGQLGAVPPAVGNPTGGAGQQQATSIRMPAASARYDRAATAGAAAAVASGITAGLPGTARARPRAGARSDGPKKHS